MKELDKGSEELFEDCKRIIDSTSLVTARMIESIVRNSQLASSTTPEMLEMFQSWLKLVSGEVIRNIGNDPKDINIEETAGRIGLTSATLLSLLLYLHRNGSIKISGITIERESGDNTEICHDLI